MIDQPMHWQPRPHQLRARRWLKRLQTGGLLLLDMGLMKTSTTLSAFDQLRKAKKARGMLVVAPLRPCYLVWSHEPGIGELWKWLEFHHLTVSLLHGSKKEQALERDADLYVVNWDGLRWLDESGGFRELLARGVDTLVLDESSKAKNMRTLRVRSLKPYLPRFARRWLLTGTPCANNLIDLFGQAYCADLGETFGRFITHYRIRYFYPTGYGGFTWKLQPGAEKEIYQRLKRISLSMRARDHLGLPPLIEQDLYVDLPEKARIVYDAMEEDFLAQLDDGVLTAANAGVASGKCRQLASGGVYQDSKELDDDGFPTRRRSVQHVHDAKTEALADLIGELQGDPLLVLYEFHHDLERIRGKLAKKNKPIPAINGKTSDHEATAIVRRWNAGELPVLCGQTAAMGYGLNLQQACSHIAIYSQTWDLERDRQAVKRIHRPGQQHRVIVHRLIARDTVDEVISATLRRKSRTQESLLNELRSYADKRRRKNR